MKVLWLTTCPCGSIKRNGKNQLFGGWIFSLEEELKKEKDIELSVAYFSSSQRDCQPFSFEGVNYYPIYRSKWNNLLMRIKGKHSTNIILECSSLIKKISPDLIHIHGTEHSFPLIVGHTNIPIVISMQSILSSYVDKYYSGIPKNIANRYDGLKLKLLFMSSKAMFRLTSNTAQNELKALKHLKYIMGRTQWDYNFSRLAAPSSIYYKCDEMLRDEFYHNVWERPNNKNVILTTTMSDSIYKGLDVVYNTARILKHFGLQFTWYVIGQEKGANYDRVTRKYTKINPEQVNVSLVGRKNTQDLIKILLDADIFVQVSHIENSPNALCEAMLLGMPIIASYVGGTASLLTDRKEGVLVQEGDCYAYASTIFELITRPDEMVEYGKNARQRALIRHDKSRIVQQVLCCYKDMMQKGV